MSESMHVRGRREELAHGGLVSRSGNLVQLGDGSQWWLNGMQWARDEADGLIAHDRRLIANTIHGRTDRY